MSFGAWPLEPTARQAVEETVADGRHEWRAAGSAVQRAFVALRLVAAITRAVVGGSWRDLQRPANAWRSIAWISLSLVVTVTVTLFAPSGIPFSARPNILVSIFVMTSPITLCLVALCGRRGSRLPVLSATVLAFSVIAFVLLAIVPFTMPLAYPAAFKGRAFVMMLAGYLAGNLLAALAVTLAGLLLADRVINHARRGFMTLMALLLPFLGLLLEQRLRFDYAPYGRLAGLTPPAEWQFVAALAMFLLWAELSRQAKYVEAAA